MNILIIDDEPLILKSVYGQIMRTDLDLDLVDTAGSAQEAREKMETNYYHIFLCDIVMPREDGITFAKWVLGKYPDCKFIFLTAHADFEYMKEAISMRSFDYILQPAQKEELENVVRRAMMQISIEKKNRELIEKGYFFSGREMDVLDGNAMLYLRGVIQDSSYLQRLIEMRLGGRPRNVKYFPFVVQILRMNSSWEEKDKSLLRSTYYNIIDELMAPLNTRNVIIMRSDRVGNFIGLILFSQDSGQQRQVLLEQLENMRLFFQKLIGIEIAVYCGDFCSFEQIYGCCEPLLLEQQNNVRSLSRIYQVSQADAEGEKELGIEARLASWKALLNQSRFQEVKSSFGLYLDHYANSGQVNREMLMRLHQSISEILLGCMASMNVSSAQVFDDKLSYYDFMYCFRQVEEMKEAVGYVLDRLYALSDVSSQDVIESTIRYIRQNIDTDILVSELADRVGMNPEYLTRIFKKSTGMGLKRFIDNEKMEVAKTLLSTTNLPVTIVSERAGYANYSNFTRSFKQIVGCTPSEYREKERE